MVKYIKGRMCLIDMEDKAFELLTTMYSEFIDFRKEVNDKLDKKADKSDIARIENDHGKKLEALFDGYKQNADKLERIENEVSKQEEIIMRRVK